MEIVVSVFLGVGLAAACGFRVFVPLLATSLAGQADLLTLHHSFEWIESRPALALFAVATVLEIAGYYIPWVDNLLDVVAGPAAVVAGVVVSASVISGMNPVLQWGLAVIAGGGASGVVQLSTTAVRALSTATTGGFANFTVSTTEVFGAVTLSVVAVLAPVVAAGMVVVVMFVATRRINSWRRRRRITAGATLT